VFYFVVLTFRIRITSAPMNCFVMLSQLVVIFLDHYQGFQGALMVELNLTSHYVQNHSYVLWILEPGLLLLSHSTIMREPRTQKHPCACPPVCVCLLSTTAHCSYIIMLVLNYMDTTSDQLFGFGNHFTDVASLSEGGGIQKPPLLMSLPHSFFCPTAGCCMCSYS